MTTLFSLTAQLISPGSGFATSNGCWRFVSCKRPSRGLAATSRLTIYSTKIRSRCWFTLVDTIFFLLLFPLNDCFFGEHKRDVTGLYRRVHCEKPTGRSYSSILSTTKRVSWGEDGRMTSNNGIKIAGSGFTLFSLDRDFDYPAAFKFLFGSSNGYLCSKVFKRAGFRTKSRLWVMKFFKSAARNENFWFYISKPQSVLIDRVFWILTKFRDLFCIFWYSELSPRPASTRIIR